MYFVTSPRAIHVKNEDPNDPDEVTVNLDIQTYKMHCRVIEQETDQGDGDNKIWVHHHFEANYL